MKKKLLALGLAVMTVAMSLVGCSEKAVTWTVTCPWAPSGVAAMVSQKAASLSNTYSDKIILVADAVKGDAATVNSWVAETKANDPQVRDFSPSPPFLIRQRCSSLTMISSLLKTCILPFSLCLLIPSSISRILMI